MLGKAKGTLQKSKFDQHLVRIKELLSYGLSVRKIARVLGYSSHIALNTYIKMIEWRSAQSGYSIGFVGDRAVCQIIWKICDPRGNLIGSAASFVDR